MLRQDSDHIKSQISQTIKTELGFSFIFDIREILLLLSLVIMIWPGMKVCIKSNKESDLCRSAVSYEGREE